MARGLDETKYKTQSCILSSYLTVDHGADKYHITQPVYLSVQLKRSVSVIVGDDHFAAHSQKQEIAVYRVISSTIFLVISHKIVSIKPSLPTHKELSYLGIIAFCVDTLGSAC